MLSAAQGIPSAAICPAIQPRNGASPSETEYCRAVAAWSSASAAAKASRKAAAGNKAGSGMPPAKDKISGWSRSFRSSRISEAFIREERSARIWIHCMGGSGKAGHDPETGRQVSQYL